MIALQGRYRIPSWRDARWLLLAFLLTYAVLALKSQAFTRTPAQFLASVLSCVGLDVLLNIFYKRIRLVPLSGLISSFGTFLLTDSPELWPYYAVGTLSILSKHFITVDGRHVFNPNNFGVVVITLFFSETAMSEPGRWGGHWWQAAIIGVLGTLCVVRARRWTLSFSYVGIFALGVLVRHWLLGAPITILGAAMTGAAFSLFVFYMISDPATTPPNPRGQIVFATVLAILDTILRHAQFKYAPLVALLVVCAVYSAIRGRSASRPKESSVSPEGRKLAFPGVR